MSKNGCSYKEALSKAKFTYTPKSGAGVKSTAKKAVGKTARAVSKGTKRASKVAAKSKEFVQLLDPSLGSHVDKISDGLHSASVISGKVADKTGGSVKTIARKARNTVKRVKKETKKVSKIVDKALPVVGAINPEAGLALAEVNSVAKAVFGSGGKKLGSKKNKYIDGCTFSVHGAGSSSKCCKCGGSFKVSGSGLPVTNSSLIHPSHPSFKPLPPKSVAKRQKEN